MNTKLNMSVIEDKSITYSKLADDVAESITAILTDSAPDWNAKEEEAGHIKNRTHGINDAQSFGYMSEYINQEGLKYTIDFGLEYLMTTGQVSIYPMDEEIPIKIFNVYDNSNFVVYLIERNVLYKIDFLDDIGDLLGTFTLQWDRNNGVIIADDEYSNSHIDGLFNNMCNVADTNIVRLSELFIPDTIARKTDVATPDWNAQEGEAGYIKNRTHYSDTIRYGLPSNVENYEISFSNVGGRDAIFNFYFRGTFITEIIKRDDASEHLISASGANIKIKRKGDILFYITTNTNFSDTEYIESVSVVKQLSDYYIPDTIARKSEFTTINGQSITEGGNIDLVADGDEVSSLTLKPGCKIGSFSVDSDNNLSSHDVEHIVISNNSISISSDDYVDFTTIKDGRLQIVSEREDMPAMSIAGPNGIEIADPLRNQFDGYAIRAYDGMFGGLRPWVRVINDSSSSSDKTLTELDHTILIYTSSQQTIVLPNKPKDGQEYDILMSLTNSTSVKHVISSNSANIFVPKEGNLKSSLSVDAHGYIKLIYVKDSGFWWYYRMA